MTAVLVKKGVDEVMRTSGALVGHPRRGRLPGARLGGPVGASAFRFTPRLELVEIFGGYLAIGDSIEKRLMETQ
jgi:hypothetical protein